MTLGLPLHGPGTLLGARYRLDDDVRLGGITEIWRGTDLRLQRPVSIRLIPADSPRAPAAKAAALRAARINSRFLIPVLDLIDEDGMVAIVSDWTDWPTLGYLAGEPLSTRQAVDISLRVGQALAALQDHDSAHGRLHPNSVHLDSHGQVRLRGQGVDAAIHGLDQDLAEAQRADAKSQLAMLYLALTAHWPEGRLNGRDQPVASGRLLPPNQVVAGIPESLNRLLERGLDDDSDHPMSVREINSALAVARDGLDREPPVAMKTTSRRTRVALRSVAVGFVALAVGGLVMAGITQASDQARSRNQQTAVRTDDGVVVSPRDPKIGATESTLAITGMTTLDPYGDGSEYPQMLPNITDGDLGTAWTSKPYFTADVGGKPGVGVVFDLGQPEQVSALDLQLSGTSTDLTVMLGDNAYGGLDSFTEVASVQQAGQSVFIRLPRPTEARAVLVWFTQLSQVADTSWSDTGFRAGIREAVIYGPHGETTK